MNTDAIESLTVKTQSLLTNFTDIVPEVDYLIQGIHMAQDYSNSNSDRITDLKIVVDAKANQTDVTSSALDFLALNTKLIAMQTELTELKGAGTVAQVVTFQTREMKRNQDNVSIGYQFSGAADVWRDRTDIWLDLISPASLTITPKAANNKIIISFLITYNIQGEVGDYGFVVKRLAGGVETMLPNATDSNDNPFAVISSPLVDGGTANGHTAEIRIIDESCLDVSTQYRLYIRCTDADSTFVATFYLNGPGGGIEPGGAVGTYEGMLSSVTLTEIRSGQVAVPIVAPAPVTILPVVVPVVPVVLVP